MSGRRCVRRRERRLTPAAIAAVCLAVSACGGHAVTKKDVIARADGICVNAVRQVREVAPPAGSAGLAPYLAKVLPVVRKEAAAIRALPRPSQDRALLDRYIAAMSADETAYRQLAAAADRRDSGAIADALSQLRQSRAPALAKQYGLSDCGSTAGTGVS